jgi:hypothetical protein
LELVLENEELKITSQVQQQEEQECIYLLQEREFVKSGENVFKIGRTINFKSRMCDYPRGSKIVKVTNIFDATKAEKELLLIFEKTFLQRKDIGKEYFEGQSNQMGTVIDIYFVNNK